MFSIDQLLIHPNDGELEHVPGFATLQKLTAEQTGGAFSIVEHPIEVGVLVAPVHTHSREDEYSYVLQGQVSVMIGGEEAVARPGTYVCKPRGIPHTFWNAGDVPARILEIICPAGFEKYFLELAPILSQGDAQGEPDIGVLMALGAKYGLTFDMDATMMLAQKHRLRLS